MSGVIDFGEADATRSFERGEKLSVLVPCHNEASTICELLNRVRAVMTLAEIIVVDDGSTDGSTDLIRGRAEGLQITTVFLANRGGKGAAIHAGLPRVSREWIVIQDGDLEYSPEDLRVLAVAAQAHFGSAVYGSRYLHQGRAEGGGLAPYLGVKLLGLLVALLYGKHLSDTHTCYKLLPTDLMRRLSLKAQGFDFCAEVTSKLLRLGIPIFEVPISYHPRTHAEGKKVGVRDFFQAIGSYLHWRFANIAPLSSNEQGESVPRRSPGTLVYRVTRFLTGVLLVFAGAAKLAPWHELALTDRLVLSTESVFAIGITEFALGVLVLSFAASGAIH